MAKGIPKITLRFNGITLVTHPENLRDCKILTRKLNAVNCRQTFPYIVSASFNPVSERVERIKLDSDKVTAESDLKNDGEPANIFIDWRIYGKVQTIGASMRASVNGGEAINVEYASLGAPQDDIGLWKLEQTIGGVEVREQFRDVLDLHLEIIRKIGLNIPSVFPIERIS